MTSRRQLRRRLRRQRRALSPAQQNVHARRVAHRLAASSLLLATRRFAAYVANDGELDPGPIIRQLLARGRFIALPALVPGGRLTFHRYTPRTPLVRNRFGILEPDRRDTRPVPPHALDVIFVPLVAFDAQGHRLGMGGGYYDKTLANLAHRERRPLLVGLAHELQRTNDLTAEEWDVPLDAAITEHALYLFSARALRYRSTDESHSARTAG